MSGPRWSVLVVLFAASLAATPARADDDPTGPVTRETRTSRVHVPGLRYAYGTGGHTLGLGYMYAFERYDRLWLFHLLMRFGIGPDVEVNTEAFRGLRGGLGYLSGRAAFIGNSGGFSLELAGGAGTGSDGTALIALGGIYFATQYFDIGYAYQLPIGSQRPAWLSAHNLSIRLHIPVARHHEKRSVHNVGGGQ